MIVLSKKHAKALGFIKPKLNYADRKRLESKKQTQIKTYRAKQCKIINI